MKRKITAAFLALVLSAFPVFADYKLSQQRTISGSNMTQEFTTYSKGVRRRSESRTIMTGVDAQQAAMMAKMMPNFVNISQCDLKRDLTLSDAKKAYFIDYYEPPTTPATPQTRAPKITVKGTTTVSSVVTDSGKRQQMFGLTARWLRYVNTFESSPDSCEGSSSMRIEEEGWYVNLSLSSDSCDVPRAPTGPRSGGCRSKVIVKSSQNPGFLLEGTTKTFQDGKVVSTTSVKTLDLSTAKLDQSLFEIPQGWTEVFSMDDLMPSMPSMSDIIGGQTTPTPTRSDTASSTRKSVAIADFTGSTSKINQAELRSYIANKIDAAGFAGVSVGSQGEIASGKFANVIGVEIKKVKESSGAKIGGLFGKVTGTTDAAKLGDSEAEIVITLYASDGKTVVANVAESAKVKGKIDDAVKAAIDKALANLLAKIK